MADEATTERAYGFERHLNGTMFDEAIEKVTSALKQEADQRLRRVFAALT